MALREAGRVVERSADMLASTAAGVGGIASPYRMVLWLRPVITAVKT